jgi:hypothetical protein
MGEEGSANVDENPDHDRDFHYDCSRSGERGLPRNTLPVSSPSQPDRPPACRIAAHSDRDAPAGTAGLEPRQREYHAAAAGSALSPGSRCTEAVPSSKRSRLSAAEEEDGRPSRFGQARKSNRWHGGDLLVTWAISEAPLGTQAIANRGQKSARAVAASAAAGAPGAVGTAVSRAPAPAGPAHHAPAAVEGNSASSAQPLLFTTSSVHAAVPSLPLCDRQSGGRSP